MKRTGSVLSHFEPGTHYSARYSAGRVCYHSAGDRAGYVAVPKPVRLIMRKVFELPQTAVLVVVVKRFFYPSTMHIRDESGLITGPDGCTPGMINPKRPPRDIT